MKKSSLCVVNDNVRIAENTYRMLICAPETAQLVKPGQFVHIKIPHDRSLLLRRPISISNVFTDSGGIIEIIYRVTGTGTYLLSQIKSTDFIDVLGPLGNGFTKPKFVKRAFVVGGGCGIAPLKLLIKDWDDVRFSSFLGFKSKPYAYDLDQFELLSEYVFVSTDDGSLGHLGVVTDLLSLRLEREVPDLILGCGPTSMLKETKDMAAKHGIPCQISLEERMGCGIGGCLVCVCETQKGTSFEYKKVCSDGPVFWSNEVLLNFDESEC